MALLNVDPEKKSDAFYRYKMPAIQTKVEGNGNGIKTVVCNIIEVSDRLARNVEYPMRFFAHELAATSKLKDDKWILTGQHGQDKIQACVFDFIKRFVLCKKCRNPETVIRVDPKKNIFLDCKACSCTTEIMPTEKLCNVILKFEKVVADEGKKGEKKDKEKKKSKEEKPKKEKTRSEKEEEIFDTQTRQAREEDAIDTEQIDRPNPVGVLKEFLASEPPPTLDDIVSKVLDLKEDYGLTDDSLVVSLVFEALFDKDITTQFPAGHKILKRFVKTAVEKHLINNLLCLCAAEETLKPKFHILLKKFYDKDLIAEPAITAWFERNKRPKGVSKSDYEMFRTKSQPFVDWLQESDDDDEDSDEESSGGEANGKAKSPQSPSSPVKKPAAKAKGDDDEEDDIDIDAI